MTASERITGFSAGLIGALIIGAVMLATFADPASVLAAMCLVPLLTTPFVAPPRPSRRGRCSRCTKADLALVITNTCPTAAVLVYDPADEMRRAS
jgi:hypothetical protein